MDLKTVIDTVLTHPEDKHAWVLLIDVVEEARDTDKAWRDVHEYLREHLQDIEWEQGHAADVEASVTAMKFLFRGIASANYPYAVQLHLRWSDERRTGEPYRSRDSGLQNAAVDGMNTARCGKDWEANLEQEQIEEVLSEQGNLEKKPLTYRDGMLEGDLVVAVSDEHRHRWWLAFAPEWMNDLDDSREYLTLVSHGGGYGSEEPEYLIIDGSGEEDEIWKKIAEPAHGAERECIYSNWDPETREDVQGTNPKVKLSHTYCGTHPGRWCRYCEAAIGEEHGYIYIGEGAETVYMRLVDEEEDDEEGDE